MDEKLRDKIVTAVEKSFCAAGAKDYESGIEQARKLIALAYDGVESMKTPNDLRALLDSCPSLSRREQMICFFVAWNLPGLCRIALKLAAKRVAHDLPAINTGRPPALSTGQILEALNYVSKLNRSGCPLEVAQWRTARKFDCSLRTIQRLWKDRAEFSSDSANPEVSVEEVIEYFK